MGFEARHVFKSSSAITTQVVIIPMLNDVVDAKACFSRESPHALTAEVFPVDGFSLVISILLWEKLPFHSCCCSVGLQLLTEC